jgi:hypothetical protein
VFWNLYDRGKSFPTEKRTFFSLSSVLSAIFHTNFYFITVSGSESDSKSELFSDPGKIFGFFQIWIHNTTYYCSSRVAVVLIRPNGINVQVVERIPQVAAAVTCLA